MDGYSDTLFGLEYLRLARDFLQAFRDLPQRPPPLSWPRYLMLCHAVELLLKAFLLHRGTKLEELKKYPIRHSLVELMRWAQDQGLKLDAEVTRDIELLSEAHEAFWHRYPRKEAKPVYVIEQFEATADALFKAVEKGFHASA